LYMLILRMTGLHLYYALSAAHPHVIYRMKSLQMHCGESLINL
jgi:hypothetical protein